MPSSTSSSERRFLVALIATFLALAGTWELVLRRYSGATLEFAIQRPQMKVASAHERWVVFGNCLVMTGISPAKLSTQLAPNTDRTIFNIASHEQSPIAYFEYLRRAHQYPQVVIANVSSWIRSTNFAEETALVESTDPLALLHHSAVDPRTQQSYGRSNLGSSGELQNRAENALAQLVSDHVWSIGHRYHLFDFALFTWTLATTWKLENALYQLNIQSWFSVTSSETDGFGYVGVNVAYRGDWDAGLDQMAERYLKRMRLSRLLTDEYWSLLARDIAEFRAHGTHVLLIRMPEHPTIREFNDSTYDVPGHLATFAKEGVPVLDLSQMGPAEGVHLFDSVHPDAASAAPITQRIGAWLRQVEPRALPH